MNKEELIDNIGKICPKMLAHDNFMRMAESVFCEETGAAAGKNLSDEERKSWRELKERLHTATVAQVIAYLRENFRPDDPLCYMDCVQGYRNDCKYIAKNLLGSRFFYRVKDLKKNISSDDIYPYVNDDDIVI